VATEDDFPGAGLIQAALDSYAEGWIARADQTLQQVQAGYPNTVAAVRARQIIAHMATIQELQGKAQLAKQQDRTTRALDCWDQVLQLDGELLGDRPSFFAEQVSLQLQSLLYDQALKAFKNKDSKAGELCETILKINPLHQDARALLKRLG
jgi:tetratricopeptide (TPR) repeat protein